MEFRAGIYADSTIVKYENKVKYWRGNLFQTIKLVLIILICKLVITIAVYIADSKNISK